MLFVPLCTAPLLWVLANKRQPIYPAAMFIERKSAPPHTEGRLVAKPTLATTTLGRDMVLGGTSISVLNPIAGLKQTFSAARCRHRLRATKKRARPNGTTVTSRCVARTPALFRSNIVVWQRQHCLEMAVLFAATHRYA